MKNVIIYIPGLGNSKGFVVGVQRLALKTWKYHRTSVEVIPMHWKAPNLQPRFDTLLKRIDELHASGANVSLIGTSAGASTAVAAYATKKEQVTTVVTVCGKLHGSISGVFKSYNPSFAQSLELLHELLPTLTTSDKKRILNVYSRRDMVVPAEQAKIIGAKHENIGIFEHNIACMYLLLFRSRTMIRFIKSKAKK